MKSLPFHTGNLLKNKSWGYTANFLKQQNLSKTRGKNVYCNYVFTSSLLGFSQEISEQVRLLGSATHAFQLAVYTVAVSAWTIWSRKNSQGLVLPLHGGSFTAEISDSPNRSLKQNLKDLLITLKGSLRGRKADRQKLEGSVTKYERGKLDLSEKDGGELSLENLPSLMLEIFTTESQNSLLHFSSIALMESISVLRKGAVPETWDEVSWSSTCHNSISNLILPILREWLSSEYKMKFKISPEKVDISEAMQYFAGNDNWILHKEAIFYRTYGNFRPGSRLSQSLSDEAVSLVIEDLMVHLAESVSRIYVDLTVEAEDLIPWPPLTKLKYSSTRAIIAFRNKLFMNHWVLFNYESVLAMYADKYNLWTLKKNAGRKSMRKSSLKVRENYWVMGKNERQIDASNSAEENCLLIKRCLPIRRASDLQQLEKWRLFFSVYLELSDIFGPISKSIGKKIGQLVSFLLSTLIGRALGLIYSGIRQSFSKVKRRH